MKKVLIVANNMEIGGAERALLGLLNVIDTTQYDVDLFLLHHSGAFLDMIPDNIHLLPEIKKYSCLGVPLTEVIRKKCFGVAFGRMIGKIKTKKHIKMNNVKIQNSVGTLYSFKYTMPFLPMVSEKVYDLAIGYSTPYYVVEKKTKAKRKVVWIHTDYSREYADIKIEEKAWNAYDYLFGVSNAVCKSFVSKYPRLKEKVLEMDNIVSEDFIRSQANMFEVDSEMPDAGCVKLLSIGRFCSAKNFDSIPDICRKLREKGFNVKWYLIGFGGDEELIRRKIKEENVSECVIILGKKDNPYPYIKACDIYIQPSRVEGRCVSVTEAQILHKPVIITKYATSSSQLRDGYDGMIVPMDNMGCAEGIANVIRDKELQKRLIENTKKEDYSNKDEIEKLYQIIT